MSGLYTQGCCTELRAKESETKPAIVSVPHICPSLADVGVCRNERFNVVIPSAARDLQFLVLFERALPAQHHGMFHS
jgi:hypothetical protein